MKLFHERLVQRWIDENGTTHSVYHDWMHDVWVGMIILVAAISAALIVYGW